MTHHMTRSIFLPLTLTALTMSGCAGSAFWGWWYNEPEVYVTPVPSNAQLYRECTQQLPLERCNQLARQWAQEDQLDRLERQNAMMLGNQHMLLLNQYMEQQNRRY